MYNLEEHFLKKVVALVFDYDRSNCYNRFLKEHAKDKTVVDCGSGSGLLAWLALKHGAKESHALEIVPSTLEHLTRLSKITNNFHVKDIDILTEDLPKGDLYVHEIFGHSIFDEGVHHLINNLQRQGITELYPRDIKIYSASSKNFTLRKFDRIKDADKFDLNFLDDEVREFVDILETNFFGKIDYLSLLESDATVIELYSNESEATIFDKQLLIEGSLFDITPYNLPKIKDKVFTWGFFFNNNTYLNLDSCKLTTWNQTILDKTFLRCLRSQIRCKAINCKPHRIKTYYKKLQNIT